MGIARNKTSQSSDMCACGHAREAHEHYRRGTECSICDIRSCSAFMAVSVPDYASAHADGGGKVAKAARNPRS